MAKPILTEKQFRKWLAPYPAGATALGSTISVSNCVLANYFRSQNIGSDIRVTRSALWYHDGEARRVALPAWAKDLVTALLAEPYGPANPDRVRDLLKRRG